MLKACDSHYGRSLCIIGAVHNILANELSYNTVVYVILVYQ